LQSAFQPASCLSAIAALGLMPLILPVELLGALR
jgi:hypothetical protein